MARRNERRVIFQDSKDRSEFLRKLAEMTARFRALLHAFVLMDTHDHLLLQTSEANRSAAHHGLYVNVTAGDKLLFVSDKRAQGITIIDWKKAGAEGFKESAIVGKISTGRTPIALTFSPD